MKKIHRLFEKKLNFLKWSHSYHAVITERFLMFYFRLCTMEFESFYNNSSFCNPQKTMEQFTKLSSEVKKNILRMYNY